MIRKKGQTEDFIADLIPSLIIIAIGLYVLSNMQDVGKKATEETNANLLERLEDRKTMADYLAKEIEIDNKKITLNELISLSYKNEAYQKKIKEEVERIQLQRISFPDFYTRVVCLNMEINYPDGSSIVIEKDPFCAGEERKIFLPTYEGRYLTIKFQLGVALGEGSSGV